MLFDKLANWKSVLDDFHTHVTSLSIPPGPSSQLKTVALFKSALRHHLKSNVHTILSNFDTAAGHLAFLLQHPHKQGRFPDLPSNVDFSSFFPS